jgi:hypothetical protein
MTDIECLYDLLVHAEPKFTLVVSSCPWKIDAQVTTGVQITLAREKFYLPENLKERQQKDVPFSKITKEK